jgi:uncharacterized protein YceK
MERWVRVAAALATGALLSGCATAIKEAKKEEPPGLSVRLPIADTTTMNIESEPAYAHPDLPLSFTDESRGRWLTLFEMNYSPAKPPVPPLPVSGEEPTR